MTSDKLTSSGSGMIFDKSGVSTASATAELDQLITLAERVSERIRDIRDKRQRIKVQIVVMAFVGYAAIASAVFFWPTRDAGATYLALAVGAAMISVGAFSYVAMRYQTLGPTREDWDVEGNILIRLMEMIDTLGKRSFESDNVDVITRALLEMRVERIRFSLASREWPKRW